ncbi:MAG TPA: YbaY family lipoprotein, partial [Thermoanaerobaculia bacterium]
REETAALTGIISYRQRIALTPEAVVQVELRDVSQQGVEAPLIARRIIEKPGQVPIAFTLGYDASLIEPSHTYTISARITDRGQLQFVTDTRVPVLTNGAPVAVEIVVVPVR